MLGEGLVIDSEALPALHTAQMKSPFRSLTEFFPKSANQNSFWFLFLATRMKDQPDNVQKRSKKTQNLHPTNYWSTFPAEKLRSNKPRFHISIHSSLARLARSAAYLPASHSQFVIPGNPKRHHPHCTPMSDNANPPAESTSHIIWCSPRALSHAFERMIRARGDFVTVFSEPFHGKT